MIREDYEHPTENANGDETCRMNIENQVLTGKGLSTYETTMDNEAYLAIRKRMK